VFLWDGRRRSLEEQVLQPFTNQIEHGLRDVEEVARKIDAFADYRKAVKQAFPARSKKVSETQIADALCAYVRTLNDSGTRFDRYWRRADASALTESEVRGLRLFTGAAACSSCHLLNPEATFTDDSFHSVGLGESKAGAELATAAARASTLDGNDLDRLIISDRGIAALGRFNVTKKPSDIGQYRTPSLRNVARTAPYMHDGSVASLEAAIDLEIYYRSAQRGRTIVLTAQEKSDLTAFLNALSTESDSSPKGKQ
jgi:cytochrome c peroxidase